MTFPITAGAAFLSLATYYPTPAPPVEPNVVVAFTVLYAPWWLDEFDSGVAGVAPVLNTGTEVDSTLVSAVQAVAASALGHTLGTSAGGGAVTGYGTGNYGSGTYGGI